MGFLFLLFHGSAGSCCLLVYMLPLSNMLLCQQLTMFGKAALLPDSDLLRKACFEPGSLQPRQPRGARAPGRPRTTWITAVYPEALKVAGTSENLNNLLSNRLHHAPSGAQLRVWRERVKEHCSQLG